MLKDSVCTVTPPVLQPTCGTCATKGQPKKAYQSKGAAQPCAGLGPTTASCLSVYDGLAGLPPGRLPSHSHCSPTPPQCTPFPPTEQVGEARAGVCSRNRKVRDHLPAESPLGVPEAPMPCNFVPWVCASKPCAPCCCRHFLHCTTPGIT